MPHLNETVIIRVDGKLGEKLQAIAEKAGLSRSAIMRNTLGIVLMGPEKPSMMKEIFERAEKEKDSELYVRTNDKEIEKTMAAIKAKISRRKNHNGDNGHNGKRESKEIVMEPVE